MERLVFVYLSEPPDMAAIEGLGWKPGVEPRSWVAQGRDWEGVTRGPTRVEPDDVAAEVLDLEPGVRWHVELSTDSGSPMAEGNSAKRLRAAVRALAGDVGVVEEEGIVWKGKQPKRLSSPPKEPGYGQSATLTMTWFTLGPRLSEPEHARSLFETVQAVLPEAMPVRWGDREPLGYGFDDEGLEGLVGRVARSLKPSSPGLDEPFLPEFLQTKVKKPFISFDLRRASLLGWIDNGSRPLAPSLEIEMGSSFLATKDAGRRLSSAFRSLSEVIEPFYGEIRLAPALWAEGQRVLGPDGIPPVLAQRWNGFPHRPPLAMVVGPPYTAHWTIEGGRRLGELIYYGGWDELSDEEVPLAPDRLLQEFDPAPHGPLPARLPDIWPFDRPSDEEQIATIRSRLRDMILRTNPDAHVTPDGRLSAGIFTDYIEAKDRMTSHALSDDIRITLCGKDRSDLTLRERPFRLENRQYVCPVCRDRAEASMGSAPTPDR